MAQLIKSLLLIETFGDFEGLFSVQSYYLLKSYGTYTNGQLVGDLEEVNKNSLKRSLS